MTDQLPDSHVRKLFAQLRAADSRTVPSFGAVWEAASAKAERRTKSRPVRRLVIAVGVLIAAGVVLVVLVRGPGSTPQVSLSRWRSPTEFLLHGPGDASRWGVPALSGSAVQLEPFQLDGLNP